MAATPLREACTGAAAGVGVAAPASAVPSPPCWVRTGVPGPLPAVSPSSSLLLASSIQACFSNPAARSAAVSGASPVTPARAARTACASAEDRWRCSRCCWSAGEMLRRKAAAFSILACTCLSRSKSACHSSSSLSSLSSPSKSWSPGSSPLVCTGEVGALVMPPLPSPPAPPPLLGCQPSCCPTGPWPCPASPCCCRRRRRARAGGRSGGNAAASSGSSTSVKLRSMVQKSSPAALGATVGSACRPRHLVCGSCRVR